MEAVKRYLRQRRVQQLAELEARDVRLAIFADGAGDLVVLPEDSIYHGGPDQTTIYRMGAITRKMTIPEEKKESRVR